MSLAVAHTTEFQRILDLPRRSWSAEDLASLANDLTSILRTPAGTMALRPVQALALHDAGIEGGLFGPIGVGEGKTLVTLLLPLVLEARRPLLLLPAGLIQKTERDRAELSKHWRIPNSLRIFSYDLLGRVQSAQELDQFEPDVIICDEVHRLKNRRAAVTRRVARYMYARPLTKFCGLSGTVMDKSITDFGHILRWALKLNAPVPITNDELNEWAEALDEHQDPMMPQRRPGALLEFALASERANDVLAARRGFRRRLTETPGVVATIGEGEHIDASIYVREIRHKVAPHVQAHFKKLRSEWLTPDDWQLTSGADIWRHAQELALGLHYIWSPRPPEEWRNARREWNAFARDVISRGRTYDSELHVANACDAGKLDASALNRWRAVKDTFTPNVVPVWHDDSALKICCDWMKQPGIIWTEHSFFAQKLSKVSGVPYYGAKGFDSQGHYIEDAKPGESAIASIDANREGKNLQGLWSRNLMVCPPTSALWWEQVIARTHRSGQTADEVIVDVLLSCRENYDCCVKAIEGARVIQEMTGKVQKLLLADVLLPSLSEVEALCTPAWSR